MVEVVLLMVLGLGWLVLGFIADAERREQREGGSAWLASESKSGGSGAFVEEVKTPAYAAPGVQPTAEPVVVRGLV